MILEINKQLGNIVIKSTATNKRFLSNHLPIIAAMIPSLVVLGTLLSMQTASTYGFGAGESPTSQKVIQGNPRPTPLPQQSLPDGQSEVNYRCKNRPASGDEWACEKKDIGFPTVKCIREDIRTCGNVSENSVFYSFGMTTEEARIHVRDRLVPKGVMFQDTLDVGVS